MYQIAVCDDEQSDLNQAVQLTERILQEADIPCAVTAYGSGVTLLSEIQRGRHFDLLLLDVIMDTLDGFAAKKLDRLSPLGAELDSLCDGINFVLVPAIYAIVRMHMGIGTVIGAGVYCICGILRLGYYNMLIEENGEEKIFVGVPTTIASMFVLVAVWFLTVVCPQLRIAVPSVLVFCGLLMICRLEFHGTNRSRVWWALAGLGFMIAAVVIGR